MGFQQLIKFLLQSLEGAQYAISRNCVNSLTFKLVCNCYKQKGSGRGVLVERRRNNVFVNITNRCHSAVKDLLHKNEQQMLSLSHNSNVIVYTLTSNCVIKSLFLLTSVARIMSSMRLKTSCLGSSDKQYINMCVLDTATRLQKHASTLDTIT